MQLLLPGEDIKFSDPADVGGSYEAFQYRTLLACCAAMGVPYTNVTGDLRPANYSSLREGKLEFRRRIEQVQHGTLVFQLCRPVWNRWLRDAVDASVADVDGVAILRLAEVHAGGLVWPDGIAAGEKTAALGELAALTIIARRPDTIVGFVEGFVVQGEPERRDPDRLVWTVDTRSA
jgi:hypothetical protein